MSLTDDKKFTSQNGIANEGFSGSKEVLAGYRPTTDVDVEKKFLESITYTWSDINCWVGSPDVAKKNSDTDVETGSSEKKKSKVASKQILKDVSGSVYPGQLLALMGASGAGKTTLLNLLTFRNMGRLKASGELFVNGFPVTADKLTSISAYVQQDDLFIGSLTVREHLVFQALVRMHKHIPYKQRMKRVEEVIVDLGLSKCADTIIGVPGKVKGVSGGEMKRLAFASEVLTDPPLMFCDEPTSGLDSFMAENVITVLQDMAKKGKTIVCTIHQPSSEVYEKFDRILLMAEGRTAFLGDTKDALTYFEEQNFPCPNNYNPSDFFIQTLAIQPENEESCREKVRHICDAFEVKQSEMDKIPRSQKNSFAGEVTKRTKKQSIYKASWMEQFRALLWRSWLTVIKDSIVIKIRIIQTLFISLLTGVIYFGQDLDQEGVMNINGAIFLILINLTMQNLFAVVNVFCAELPVFLREHFNGMYRTDTYFLAKMLAELGVFIVSPIIFLAISYFMVGLNSGIDKFIWACVISVLVANISCSFGYMISCVSPNVQIALAIAPACVIPFMLFGGFFLNKDSIPVYLVWLKYFSWFLYANEAFVVNNWDGIDEIECNRELNATAACLHNGDEVLGRYNFDKDNSTIDMVALVALLIGYRVLAYIALLTRTFRKQ